MAEPRPRRLRLPDRPEYGLGEEGQPGRSLSWDTVQGRLASARYYWLATTRRDGSPHAVPVWGVWLDGCLWFATSPETLTARNLAADPRALAHAESAREVVVVRGTAERPEPALVPEEAVAAYERKYGWRLDPLDEGMPFFALRAELVQGWDASDVRGTAARWLLGSG